LGTTELDKKIIKRGDFKNVVNSVLNRQFTVDIDKIKRAYIDINSCISIIYRYGEVNNPDIGNMIYTYIELCLTKFLGIGAEVILLVTGEPSVYHQQIYPDWCKARYSRVDLQQSESMKKLLVALKKFGDENSSIKVVGVGKNHPIMEVKQRELGKRIRYLVLTKDTLFHVLKSKFAILWNGTNMIDLSDNNRQLPDGITLENPDLYLPYYLTIRGDDRNEYSGIEGYGKQRALKYLQLYKLEILSGLEHPLKETVDKFIGLYDVDQMLKYFQGEKDYGNQHSESDSKRVILDEQKQ